MLRSNNHWCFTKVNLKRNGHFLKTVSVWRIQWLEFLATALIGAKVLEVYSRCFCAFFSTVKKVNLILLLLWKSFWTCGSHERICKLPRVSRPCFENHWFKRCCLSYYYSNKTYQVPIIPSHFWVHGVSVNRTRSFAFLKVIFYQQQW